MVNSDAAEQIVRLSLNGIEMALRVSGPLAKGVATFIAAAATAAKKHKGKDKLKGCTRLNSMLKSGKPLEIFSLKEADLEKFVKSAKSYGIVYSVVKNPKDCKDNLCDIMVKAEDAPKIARMAERFGFTTLNHTQAEHERERAAPEQTAEPDTPNKGNADALANELCGKQDGNAPENPTMAQAEQNYQSQNPPSAPISRNNTTSAAGFSSPNGQQRASVTAELREISRTQKQKKESDAPARDENLPPRTKPRNQPAIHKQPPRGRKPKSSGRNTR